MRLSWTIGSRLEVKDLSIINEKYGPRKAIAPFRWNSTLCIQAPKRKWKTRKKSTRSGIIIHNLWRPCTLETKLKSSSVLPTTKANFTLRKSLWHYRPLLTFHSLMPCISTPRPCRDSISLPVKPKVEASQFLKSTLALTVKVCVRFGWTPSIIRTIRAGMKGFWRREWWEQSSIQSNKIAI